MIISRRLRPMMSFRVVLPMLAIGCVGLFWSFSASAQLASCPTGSVISNLVNQTCGESSSGSGVYAILANGSNKASITNSGTITATSTDTTSSDPSAIFNNGRTIGTIVNNLGGLITSISTTGNTGFISNAAIFNNGGTITTISNAGSISATVGTGNTGVIDAYGIFNNGGTINEILNTGTIEAVIGTNPSATIGSQLGIRNNGGTITTLNNSQGAGNAAGALTYTGALPTNYNVIITSASNYGKLSGTSVTGSTNFGIYAGATITTKLYTGVLQGLTTSNVGATRTGTYSGFNYTLALQSGSSTIWDLIFTGTADTQPSLAASAYALRGVYNLQTATINNGLNYDCTVFDTHGVCISVGGRYTSTDSPGTNNGNALVVASYNLTDHVRVGGYLDQNISNSTPTGIKLNNGSPLAGLFGVWNEHKSGEGLEVRVAAGYGDKDLTVTRSAIGTSEAGVGKSQLTSQAVSTTVSYGTALASNWMVSPYAGVRYTRIKAGRYTEGSSADVTAPLTYDALVQQSTTALAGVRFSGRASPKTLLTMSAGVEQDTNNVGNSYNASGVTGLTPITFNSNIQKTRAVANAGVYYDITNTQRIGLNAMYRQEAFQSTNTVTALVTYQVGL